MRKIATLLVALFFVFTVTSCYTTTHTVGNGGGSQVQTQKAWYVLWGLVPLNESKANAGKMVPQGTENYTIKTQHTFVDLLISAVTGIVSVQVQTVKVEY